jgi:hypothetical protein
VTQDVSLQAKLREVSDNHLGSLARGDLAAPQQQKLDRLLARLPELGRERLPETEGKEAFVGVLQELADMV